MLPDRVFYPLIALAAAALIALASVWPQGLGTRSPAPFGHKVVEPGPPPPGAVGPVAPAPIEPVLRPIGGTATSSDPASPAPSPRPAAQ